LFLHILYLGFEFNNFMLKHLKFQEARSLIQAKMSIEFLLSENSHQTRNQYLHLRTITVHRAAAGYHEMLVLIEAYY
jgi:hypothetical protein